MGKPKKIRVLRDIIQTYEVNAFLYKDRYLTIRQIVDLPKARKNQLSRQAVQNRLDRGMSVEEAIEKPGCYKQIHKSSHDLYLSDVEEIITFLHRRERKSVAVWALAFAVNSKLVEGKTMTEVAKKIGVTRAAISKQAVIIAKQLGREE